VSRLVGARDIPAERSSASAAALALQATLDAAVKVVLVLPTAGDAEEAAGELEVVETGERGSEVSKTWFLPSPLLSLLVLRLPLAFLLFAVEVVRPNATL